MLNLEHMPYFLQLTNRCEGSQFENLVEKWSCLSFASRSSQIRVFLYHYNPLEIITNPVTVEQLYDQQESNYSRNSHLSIMCMFVNKLHMLLVIDLVCAQLHYMKATVTHYCCTRVISDNYLSSYQFLLLLQENSKLKF